MSSLPLPSPAEADAIAYLRSPRAIRDRCSQLFNRAIEERLAYFRCDLDRLIPTAEYVLQVIQAAYPALQIPFHSRWRHFEAGGISRTTHLNRLLAPLSPLERTRAKFDLAIASVLLDAGAGAVWQYLEPGTHQSFARSEGLAVASFHCFCQGLFSSDPSHPYQVDAIALEQLTLSTLAEGFQVTSRNPLVGMEGRVALLQRLGAVLQGCPEKFGEALPRPGHLVDYLLKETKDRYLSASTVLTAVLFGLADIWSGRMAIAGVNLGDTWEHSALEGTSPGAQYVPFHKLSQWLTYSLLEPLQELGLTITGLDDLTGLAEYRNGGLCIDLGLLQPRDPDILCQSHFPSSEVIVEWRALTVICLDQLAVTLRQIMGIDDQELPLVKVLEGGTWAAGRKIAAERRVGGIPPITLESDGTVF